MKILQIIQRPQLRGAEIFACQLSTEFKARKIEVDVLWLFNQDNSLQAFDLNYIDLGGNPRNRFWDFKAYQRLANFVQKGQYDIVQANAGDTLKYAALSKMLFGWKSKLVYRNANKMSAFIKNGVHAVINKFFLSQVDYVISVSENCRQDIIQFYPKLNTISSTATIGTYSFDHLSEAHRNPLHFIWINVGSFVTEKNHRFLISLFAAFYHKHPKAKLWLVGDGKQRRLLENQVKELGLENAVCFLGYRKEAISYIKAADIMVMPSLIEGLPGVILEALSCGTPVVASAVGGIPEVVANGKTGYTINDYNKEQYLSKIQKLKHDRVVYKQIVKEGKKLISEKFLMPKIAADFEKIYLHILNAKDKSTSYH